MSEMYKILEKAEMPDGTKIQLEDWSKVYPGTFDLPSIIAYPKAKRDGTWFGRGKTFRLSVDRGFSSVEEVMETFERLKYGVITLEDLADHFREERDKYYMGLTDTYEP